MKARSRPIASERFADALDETDNAWIFGVYIDGELASSIRLHVASRQQPDLPALNVFSDLLSPEIAAGRTIIDPTRFVADRAASRRYPELCYVTTRLAMAGVGVLPHPPAAGDRARRAPGLLPARVRAPADLRARHYPSLTKPISLMALDYPMARERVLQRYPFFRSTFFERRMLFGHARRGRAALGGLSAPAQTAAHAAEIDCLAVALPQSALRGRARSWFRPGGRRHMSADGTWKLTMQTPIGERKSTLALKERGRRRSRAS